MLKQLLTYKEYQEIWEHTIICKNGYAIKDFIDDIFREFGKFNTNLALSLMEYIEFKYPKIQGITELADKDITSFIDETPNLKMPSIEYLYSYLSQISRSKAYPNQKRRNHNTISFKTNYEPRKLSTLLLKLKKDKFCEFLSPSKVQWIFNDKEKSSTDEPIIWIDKTIPHNSEYYQSMLAFIALVCKENPLQNNREITSRKIALCFRKYDGSEFTLSGLTQTIKRYKKDLKAKNKSQRIKRLEEIIK